MAITDAIVQYRRFLKRRNCSIHTVKNYMHTLRQFITVRIRNYSYRRISVRLGCRLSRWGYLLLLCRFLSCM